MLALLKKLTPEERHKAGELVSNHITAWLSRLSPPPLKIAYFISMADEISTNAIDLRLQELHINRAVPIIDKPNQLRFVAIPHHMTMAQFSDMPHHIIDAHNLDVILVPGLAFDKQGHRLGRGQGYYDKALAKLMAGDKRALFVGLSMDEQIQSSIPHEKHDVAMDYLCTPRLGIIKTTR